MHRVVRPKSHLVDRIVRLESGFFHGCPEAQKVVHSSNQPAVKGPRLFWRKSMTDHFTRPAINIARLAAPKLAPTPLARLIRRFNKPTLLRPLFLLMSRSLSGVLRCLSLVCTRARLLAE